MSFLAADRRSLLEQHAEGWLRTALDSAHRAYPHQPWLVITEPGPYPTHPERHPVFHGSYDWHSCVEMVWVAVRLLRLVPGLPGAADASSAIDALVSDEGMATELASFSHPDFRGMERPYGWAWYLTLCEELAQGDNADTRRWLARTEPLAELFTERFLAWLPKLTYPQRTGLHANTAFALARSWGWAGRLADAGDDRLRVTIRDTALRLFADDTAYSAHYEPSASDFLSAALSEAELMALVLEGAFPAWLQAFLPGLADAEPVGLFHPVTVADPTDGQMAHLEGLNLSRAAAFVAIADRLPAGDVRIAPMLAAAERHAEASLGQVSGSHWMVEHWLAAYAVLLLGQ